MTAPVIQAKDVTIAYRLARNRTTSIQEFAIRLLKRQIEFETLWALRDVSFELSAGSVLGVIGPNGAGKSTLMKVVARVIPPTKGRIIVRGLVAPLIELGAGFHPDMTGYENLVLYGTILGHDPRALRRDAHEIAEWAEVCEFMDVPIRSYSSGMLSRLGFAVATWANPDVLVVDEVLSIGDQRFQERSMQRIQQMRHDGAAVLFVSHAMETVRELSETVLWLDHGSQVMQGNASEVIDAYLASQHVVPEHANITSP